MTGNLRVIGDVHGKVDEYLSIIKDCQYSIQLGDFGFRDEWLRLKNEVDSEHHKIIPGNHDAYNTLESVSHFLGHFGQYTLGGIEFFFIRGAYSIDSKQRLVDIDIFPNEQLSYRQFNDCIFLYEKVRPEIVLSHDIPREVASELFRPMFIHKNRTSDALQQMFEIHRPRLWFFGHHHISMTKNVSGTIFRCLSELEFVDVDV